MSGSISTTQTRHGGGVMVSAGVPTRGSTELIFMPSTMDSILYTDILGGH